MATAQPRVWRLRLPGVDRWLDLTGEPAGMRVMGIVNITPDSFSDGGRFLDPARAVEHGVRLAAEGAHILDLGAESTRPGGGVYGAGADEVSASEEIERLLPVLEGLRRRLPDTVLSVDTRKGVVASAALDAGADLVNDVGGLGDPDLVRAVAAAGCPVVAMHSRGHLSDMQRTIAFRDVVAEVREEQAAVLRRAEEGGIEPQQVVLDPGLGFGKTAAQNLELMAGLPALGTLDRPVLVGASRKSFLAWAARRDPLVPGSPTGAAPPPQHRLAGSLAAVAWSARLGAAIVRVHDVAETVQFLRVWNAIDSASRPSSDPPTDPHT